MDNSNFANDFLIKFTVLTNCSFLFVILRKDQMLLHICVWNISGKSLSAYSNPTYYLSTKRRIAP